MNDDEPDEPVGMTATERRIALLALTVAPVTLALIVLLLHAIFGNARVF